MSEEKKSKSKKKLVSRRDFLVGSGAVIAAGALAACTPKAVTETVTQTSTVTGTPVTKTVPTTVTITKTGAKEIKTPLWYGQEGPLPGMRKVGTTDFTCDVLVIGAGYAGTMAALRAQALGQKVIIVCKGTPGRSGLTPWANTMMFFDPTLGDTEDNWINGLQNGTEYLVDLDYCKLFMRDSLARFKEWVALGIANQYNGFPTSAELIQISQGNFIQNSDRRWWWPKLFKDKGIQVVERCMVTNLLTDSKGAVVGAAGLTYESDEVLIFRAKAVVMAAGAGTFKSGGFPANQDTFDGDYMAYHIGAKIGGMEWQDFHGMGGIYPSDSWKQGDERYIGRIYATTTPTYTLNGADRTAKAHEANAIHTLGDLVPGSPKSIYPPKLTNEYTYKYVPVDQNDWKNVRYDSDGNHPPNTWPEKASMTNPQPPDNITVGGGASGLGVHCTEGIYPTDSNCWSGIPGLWAAGDALCSRLCGSVYGGKGISSSSAGVFGYVAGEQAATYAKGISQPVVPAEQISSAQNDILIPLKTTRGFSPQWVQELILQIYAPYYIAKMKNKTRLLGALEICEFIRDNFVPKLVASDPHNNRMAHETRHMVLGMEMKLRASLFREESRGYHYRQDFPYRDDKNWLAWTRCYKDSKGTMVMEKVPVPDRMKTHSNFSYKARYSIAFLGEEEAIAKLGIK